ncbi:hypothetical protein ANABIO32_03880 [Rossellomorea marisflavi]|nr:hypothetical protein ANABIO32_03880 [Rossellomorea marisflavi]
MAYIPLPIRSNSNGSEIEKCESIPFIFNTSIDPNIIPEKLSSIKTITFNKRVLTQYERGMVNTVLT